MADILASSSYMEYQSISDHSLLTWNVALYNMQSNVIAHEPPSVDQKRVERSIGSRTQSIIGRGYKEVELSQVNYCDTG